MTRDIGREEIVVPARLAVSACILIVLGAKLWLIAEFGSATPFFDQWVDAIGVYRPYLTGSLGLSDLFAFHNEHRLLWTRLSALGLFLVTGRWDPILQAIWNAALHTAIIGGLLVALMRPLAPAGQRIFPAFIAILFAVPFAWQNTLFGICSQYYFLILFGAAALWALCGAAAWTPRWWLGTLLALSSYVTIAPGAVTLVPFLALVAIQWAGGQRRGWREFAGAAFHVVLVAAMLTDIPKLAATAELRAASLADFFDALTVLASWPVASPNWHIAARTLVALLIYAPTLALLLRLIRERAAATDTRWFLILIAGWAVVLMAGSAYGRGLYALQTRYYDSYLIGFMANGAALVYLAFAGTSLRRPVVVGIAAAWLVAVLTGAGHKAHESLPHELMQRRAQAEVQTRNLTQFLATGDFAAISGKPFFDIPFPSAEALRTFATDPTIRAILPRPLLGEPERRGAKTFVLANGPLLIPLGLAIFLVAAIAAAMGWKRVES